MDTMRIFASLTILITLSGRYARAESLTWAQCVQETLQNNPLLQAAGEKYRATQVNIKGAHSGYLPQLSGTVNWARSRDEVAGTGDNYAATLSLNQNLFTGLADQAKVDSAKASSRREEATMHATQAQVISDLKNAFAELNFATSQIALQKEIIKRRDQNLNLINLRFKSGRENRGSVALSAAYLKQANFDFLSATNDVESARADLARVLGREPSDLNVSGEIPLTVLAAQTPDFKALATDTPTAVQSMADVDVSKAAVTSARSNFFPSLNLSATTGDAGPSWYPERDQWSVGAALTFPLFNGGKDYYASQSASSTLRAARETLDNVTRDRITQLRTAYYNYIEAREKVKVDESFSEAAALRAEIARAKYNNGLMTFDDWDIVENDLITREKTVLVSRRDLITKESAWLFLQGKGL